MSWIVEFGTVRRMVSLVPVVAAVLLASATAMMPVSGQEATPQPVVCDEPPKPVNFIADLNAAPQPEITPTAMTDAPEAEEVSDPVVRADVTAVVEELILCVNQGEVLRAFSLFDDHYLQVLIDPDAVMESDVALELGESLATPEPVGEDEVTVLEEVISIRQTADGAVVVIFRSHAGTEESQVDLLALRKVGERWLIVDGVADIESD